METESDRPLQATRRPRRTRILAIDDTSCPPVRQNRIMRWHGRRAWGALLGPLFFVVVLTAGPEILKSVNLPSPAWVTPLIAALGGGFLLVATPLLQSRVEAINRNSDQAEERANIQNAARERIAGDGQVFPLVADVNDRALFGIHPAILLPASSDETLSPEFPSYVPRDVDADLHTALRTKRATGGFILLVGRAASGKSRCAYEAISAVLPDWHLCIPSNADSITTLVDNGVDLGRTVIWLDEAQKFIGPGKLESETVRRLLADSKRPTIIVGTIWPTTYGRLRTHLPVDHIEDANESARDILNLATRFEIPDFSRSEKERAAQIAAIDPRIREAIDRGSDTSLTELLAAAPELIHRWNQGDSEFGRLIVTAAVTARNCGHPEVVTKDTLSALATFIMTGNQMARATAGWFAEGIDWACQPVRGASAPLSAYAEKVGEVYGYTVSDVLVQYAAETNHVEISDEFWIFLIEHAESYAAIALFVQSLKSDNFNVARKAAERAAAAGFTASFSILAVMLERKNKWEEALEWAKRAAEEDPAARQHVGLILLRTGKYEEADAWLLDVANLGEASAMGAYGLSLLLQGRLEESIDWLRRAVTGGNKIALATLGKAMQAAGNLEEAEEYLRRASEVGMLSAQTDLARMLMDDPHRRTEAIELFRKPAESGDSRAMVGLALLLSETGSREEARALLEQAAAKNEVHALAGLGVFAAEDGDMATAESWYRRAASLDHPVAISELAVILRARGEINAAEVWERKAEDTSAISSEIRQIENGNREESAAGE